MVRAYNLSCSITKRFNEIYAMRALGSEANRSNIIYLAFWMLQGMMFLFFQGVAGLVSARELKVASYHSVVEDSLIGM